MQASLLIFTLLVLTITSTPQDLINYTTDSNCDGNWCQFCVSIGIGSADPSEICTEMELDTCADPMVITARYEVDDELIADSEYELVEGATFDIEVPFLPCNVGFTATKIDVDQEESNVGFLVSVGGACTLPLVGSVGIDDYKIDYVRIPFQKCQSLAIQEYLITGSLFLVITLIGAVSLILFSQKC